MQRCLLILGLLLVLGSAASAQCPPAPAVSQCLVTYIDADPCPVAGFPMLIWCPAGDLSRIVIKVRAIGAAGAPCAGCPLTITVRFRGMPTLTGTNLWVCGAINSMLVSTVTTDANGEAALAFSGGGCGCLIVEYVVDATACGGPPVLCSGSQRYCVKSPDITGNGIVNFQDTFRYAPMLAAGTGFCGDFNCNGAVNFQDTFVYAPHLAAVHNCTFGSTVTFATDCTLPCQ